MRARRRTLRKGTQRKLGSMQAVDSEFEAVAFIRDKLTESGWVVKDPTRHAEGQVWTQNQCLAHPEIKRCLGLTRPEYIVRLSETKLWVIEAKRDRAMLDKALSEAENDYAWPIQNGGILSVPLISGVAGNDTTGYEIRTRLLFDGGYRPVVINGHEATGLLDGSTVETLLRTGNPVIADLAVNEEVFLKAAEQINRILHMGGINKNERARVMAALLLSLLEEPGPNVDSDLPVLIGDINNRTQVSLRRHGKEQFYEHVKITPPTSIENHMKFRTAIIQTMQELKNLNIKSAMNSGADVLGKFYEVFLKYGNGAKEIGIVLTPRHITRFSVEALGVRPEDIILDPACGTGGFLVAAFDHVRKNASASQVEKFRKMRLFGIDRDPYVTSLAIVNMIFRGDGKNNIIEGNCFIDFLERASQNGNASARYVKEQPAPGEAPVTRVMMNPPFALKESDEREYRFVEAAFVSMADGGLIFAMLPISATVEGGRERAWRRDTLLAHNTLLAVVSFPEELFYPIANQTVAIVVKKGTPHVPDQPVLWARVVNDGFMKKKGKRLPTPPNVPNDLQRLTPILRNFLIDPTQPIQPVPGFVETKPLDLSDQALEIAPEAHLGSEPITKDVLSAEIDRLVREDIAFLIRSGRGELMLDE